MSERLIYEFPDGRLAVAVPGRGQRPGESMTDYRARMKGEHPSLAAAVYRGTVQAEELPVDTGAVAPVEDAGAGAPGYVPHPDPVRCWRGAWRWDAAGKRVVVDAAEREAIQWARVRAVRARLLAASDAEQMRANEAGGNTAGWRAYRQALRDVPQANQDPDAVSWPERPA